MTAATMPPEAISAAAAALTSVAAAARPLQAAREQQSSQPGSPESTSEAPRAGAGGGEGCSNSGGGSDDGSVGGGVGSDGGSSSSGRSLPTKEQQDAERRWRDGTAGATASWTPEDDVALTMDGRFASLSIDMGPIKGSAQHAHPHRFSPRKQAETDIARHIKALVQVRV